MEKPVYNFKEQLAYGKEAEKIISQHLMSRVNSIEVRDFSEEKKYQDLGIDGMYTYENESNGILYSLFFDVKADMQMHKKDTIFIETSSDNSEDEKKADGILSTKAEYFLYYDPILGRLIWLPVFPMRQWYYSKGIAKVHIKVNDTSGRTTEGIVLSIKELMEIIPFIEIELNIKKIDYIISNI